MKDKFSEIFENVSKVLVVVAHPDDADVMFGGTIARLIGQGKLVRLLICTNGAMGSKQNTISQVELAKIREFEQKKSFMELGGNPSNLFILDNLDATLNPYNAELLESVVFHFREFQPEIVLTHNPEKLFHVRGDQVAINHRDHRAVGEAVIDTTMPLARDISFFRSQIDDGLNSSIVRKLLLTTDNIDNADFVDISGFVDKKRLALLNHQSQIPTDIVNSILEQGRNEEDGNYYEAFKFIKLAY